MHRSIITTHRFLRGGLSTIIFLGVTKWSALVVHPLKHWNSSLWPPGQVGQLWRWAWLLTHFGRSQAKNKFRRVRLRAFQTHWSFIDLTGARCGWHTTVNTHSNHANRHDRCLRVGAKFFLSLASISADGVFAEVHFFCPSCQWSQFHCSVVPDQDAKAVCF